MPDGPASPIFEEDAAGTIQSAGQSTDEGKGRIFPCENCGADLEFHIGQQDLKCPYCGYEKQIALAPDAALAEQDFQAVLERVRKLREQQDGRQGENQKEVRCESCGATVVFVGTLASSACPYCGSPIQLDDVQKSKTRLPVDGVLPFLVEREKAQANLNEWIKSRWFAPNDFREMGAAGKFSGVYLPFWTYDTLTSNFYSGQRGEHYWVTVGSGKDERREQRTRWYPASGSFQRFFDDVLVPAAKDLSHELLLELEPWPMSHCRPFTQEVLAGYLARTYEVELDDGFNHAKSRIEAALEEDVRERIDGDEQCIDSIQSHYDAITFKHLLLPTWLMAYRYHDQPYQIVINAATGEVQGERPYSWIKIAFSILVPVAVVLVIAAIRTMMH